MVIQDNPIVLKKFEDGLEVVSHLYDDFIETLLDLSICLLVGGLIALGV
jgi:hypothetical protein